MDAVSLKMGDVLPKMGDVLPKMGEMDYALLPSLRPLYYCPPFLEDF